MHLLEIHVFCGWIPAFPWPKVAKKCSILKICVFLGRFLAFLWPKVPKNCCILEIYVFLGRFLAFLWPKVLKNCCIPEILVFLDRFLVFLWSKCRRIVTSPKFVSFCIQKCSNSVVWVSSLAGVITGNRCAELRSLLLLERCKIRRKYTYFGAILRCVFHALSKAFVQGEGQKVHFTILDFM